MGEKFLLHLLPDDKTKPIRTTAGATRSRGIDFIEEAINRAKSKAAERGLSATFLVLDALALKDLPEVFDSVIDCGLLHVFSDEDRKRYVEGPTTVFKPGGRLFLMCFSDEEPGTQGPKRVSKKELYDAFGQGWAIESIELGNLLPDRFPQGQASSSGTVHDLVPSHLPDPRRFFCRTRVDWADSDGIVVGVNAPTAPIIVCREHSRSEPGVRVERIGSDSKGNIVDNPSAIPMEDRETSRLAVHSETDPVLLTQPCRIASQPGPQQDSGEAYWERLQVIETGCGPRVETALLVDLLSRSPGLEKGLVDPAEVHGYANPLAAVNAYKHRLHALRCEFANVRLSMHELETQLNQSRYRNEVLEKHVQFLNATLEEMRESRAWEWVEKISRWRRILAGWRKQLYQVASRFISGKC